MQVELQVLSFLISGWAKIDPIPNNRLNKTKNQYSDLDALPCFVNDFCMHPLTESAKDIMWAGRLSIMACSIKVITALVFKRR